MAAPKPIASTAGVVDNQMTLEQAAKKAENRKAAKARKKDGKVAVSSTYTKVPFYYADGKVAMIPVIRRVAALYRMPELETGQLQVDANGKLQGKSVGKFKGKSIRVSRGYVLGDRKTATKGRKTGIGGRSISLTKSYKRVWNSLRVPLDATGLDIVFWIKTWGVKPDELGYGDQVVSLGLKKTRAQHAAETLANAKA